MKLREGLGGFSTKERLGEAEGGGVGGWSRFNGKREARTEGGPSLELSFFSPRRSRLSLEKEGDCKSGVFKGHVKIMETSS